jgi:hypothetical protein
MMLWLAGAPFDLTVAESEDELELLEPRGSLEAFPRRFVWTPVEGALAYEISVTALTPEEKLVFRQRGGSAALDLSFDEGGEPGPGHYRWEVLALRGGSANERAIGEFRVGTNP